MYIHGSSHIHSAQAINPPHRASGAGASAGAQRLSGVDELDISPEANLLSQLRDIPEIRADRVAEIRAQIAAGAYETDAKLDIALDRLLDEFA